MKYECLPGKMQLNRKDKIMGLHSLVQLQGMGGSRGGGAWGPDPPENLQNVGFLSNTGPEPLKTKPAFKVGLSPARQ